MEEGFIPQTVNHCQMYTGGFIVEFIVVTSSLFRTVTRKGVEGVICGTGQRCVFSVFVVWRFDTWRWCQSSDSAKANTNSSLTSLRNFGKSTADFIRNWHWTLKTLRNQHAPPLYTTHQTVQICLTRPFVMTHNYIGMKVKTNTNSDV